MKALTQNSIYKSMQAVKNNRVLELPSSPYFNIGYSSIGRDVFLDEVQSLLVK